MKIAIDYDGTYTAAPKLFNIFMYTAMQLGHEVFIVTMRNEDKDYINDPYLPEIIYCDGKPKKKYCQDVGIPIDIWIDDTPERIHLGSEFTPEMLKEWRNKNV